jgi:hypothetical protein
MPSIADFDRFAFVVGAPRCGTTTISRLLASHPQVDFSAVKEPHFFSQHDLRNLTGTQLRQRVEQDYLERFFDDPGSRRVGGDGSVSYLYTPEQMAPILRLWPQSRFIISLRDPMTMLPSLHERLIYIGDENLPRFEDAWTAAPERASGRRIPRSCVDPRWLRYDEAGRFGTYVERFFATVGRERCHVVLFDELTTDPAREFRRILDFLGLDEVEVMDIRPERAGQGVRSRWLQRALKRPPKAVRAYFAGEHYRRRVHKDPTRMNGKGGALEAVMAVRKRLLRWNSVAAPVREVPLRVQREIRRSFEGEVERLGVLIDRDLSHWLQPREGSNKLESPYE